MKRSLSKILKGIFNYEHKIMIHGLTSDSSKVKENFIFCALSENANNYINEALKKGAVVIISNKQQDYDVLQFIHPKPKEIYHRLAQNFYNKQPKNICAVTGTNGKTSVAYFFQQVCNLSGVNAASIGTLGVLSNIKAVEEELALTTPDSSDLHRILFNCKKNEIEYVILEASSHGIDQHRLDSLKISAAAFTNLSHDHYDYHYNAVDYFKAKLRLFTKIPKKNKTSIINIDDPHREHIFLQLKKINNNNLLTYGKNGQNKPDLKILEQIPLPYGQIAKIKIFNKVYKCTVKLFGEFQIYNLLAAIGLALETGIDISMVNFDLIKSPPGRMEEVQNKYKVKTFIDYAHTPDALRQALEALKWHLPELRIILVFGCGGNRDHEKRAKMAEVAHRIAHKIIITDDNPRDEPAENIRRDLLKFCPNAQEIPGRAKAIEYAITHAKNNEVVLVAGRGHELIQQYSGQSIIFNDKNCVEALS